jgi:hypothetical protein
MTPANPTNPITTPEAVSKLLSGLLMRLIKVKRSNVPINLAVRAPAVVAQYVQNDGSVAGVCICDLPLAAHLAASLSLVPAGVAQEDIRARALSESLMENFREILNVSSQLFMTDTEHRVSLDTLILFPGNIPDVTRETIFHPSARLDLDVYVPSYGKGKMALRTPGTGPVRSHSQRPPFSGYPGP